MSILTSLNVIASFNVSYDNHPNNFLYNEGRFTTNRNNIINRFHACNDSMIFIFTNTYEVDVNLINPVITDWVELHRGTYATLHTIKFFPNGEGTVHGIIEIRRDNAIVISLGFN